MRINFTIIIIILPFCLFSQFTEYNSNYSNVFSDTPAADLKLSSSSNFKFGNQFSNKNNTKLIISSNCLTDLYGSRIDRFHTESNDYYTEIEYNNIRKLSPELSISYHYNKCVFQISNHISKYIKKISSVGPHAGNNYLGKEIFNISNRVLSFSIGIKLNPKIISTLSILTNNYNNTLSFSEYEKKAKFQLNYFDQFQFMGAVNYNMSSNNEFYLLFKTQSPKNRIHSNVFYLPPDFSDIPITSKAVVTYTGLLSLGFQYRDQNKFRVAVEVLNHYLFANDKHTIYYENYSSKYKFKHDLWNPEIVLEFNYMLRNLNLSILYSRYINYETELNEYNDALKIDYEVEPPQALLISTSYQFSKHFKVFTSYQFSYTKANHCIPNWFQENEGFYKDKFHFIKCGLRYDI